MAKIAACVITITVLFCPTTQLCTRNLNHFILPMGLLSFLGKHERSKDLKSLMERGAIILDVRTPGEFNTGHVVGAKNIPLDSIAASINELKAMKVPIITCCASGMRSGVATSQLKSVGIESVNGGSWYSVKLATEQECT